MIERTDFLNLIHASYVAGRYDFSRRVAADWLASWPEDIEVKLLLAEAEIKDELLDQAIERLNILINYDPELTEAYELLASTYYKVGDLNRAHVYDGCRALLQREKLGKGRVPSWIRSLDRAKNAIDRGNRKKAIKQAQMALEADPDFALPTLLATKAFLAAGKGGDAQSLASSGHDRWPECIFFRILIAEDLIRKGDLHRGVEKLHKVATDDPTGRLANKYLGNDHPYQGLWPTRLTAQLSRPIPADIREIYGGNRIGAKSSAPDTLESSVIAPASVKISDPPKREVDVKVPEPEFDLVLPLPPSKNSPEDSEMLTPHRDIKQTCQSEYHVHMPVLSEDEGLEDVEVESDPEAKILRSIEQDFERIATRLKTRIPKSREDVRNPVYVILSCMQPIIARFGQSKFDRLDEAIRSLSTSIQNKPGWNAIWLYVDDPASMGAFQLTPSDPQNPWQIKLRITDLDQKLKERGEMIGALFIIGGNGIVPFHMLPNPTDDEDDAVPSDNPYATTDANYFAPEWPIGRLPSDDDVDILVRYIRSAAEEHRTGSKVVQPINRLTAWIIRILSRIFRRRSDALGYTANIWRKASLAVFRAIGNPGSLVTSPPAQVGSLPQQIINPVSLSYYNLHGLEDAPEWFGQRDPFEDSEGLTPDFPVALRPDDVVNGGRAPKVVFTEACYGANVIGKSAETAICLKFLDSGSKALVGSTKISYGSVTPPLIAADLLGRHFWDGYVDGYPVGEALRRAKLQLASEMHRRQGFLDGEDQKTLISFILFGDPLWTTQEVRARASGKSITRKSVRPAKMKTACALGGPSLDPDEIEPIMMSKVRSIVSDYLPGMADAICKINPQHQMCNGVDHVCPTHQLKLQKEVAGDQPTVVVSFSKHVSVGRNRHPHYARLTLDKHGKVLKLAVSR
jgi:tetratricopeptide (TPR) repeat protein